MIDTVKPTLDEVTTIKADGSRRFIHSAQAKGRFTRWRAFVGIALIAIYVALPWISINGNPAVFMDVANRQFHFFGLTFVAQDLWIGFFLITGIAFSLFYVSALFGRIWCGWGCPQTVFLDIAHRIERWVEGDAPARRRLDRAPWTLAKTIRRGIKHAALAAFALLLAHVFLSYFVSLPRLYSMMRHSPGENWSSFLFVFLTAGALWFDLAWFREQFCIVLCPYGRLQSALIDNHSLVVGYDAQRGEPRGRKGTPGAADCVDCRRCVQVCPTGIDIRQGLQMECIGCAACIDACDTVMDKIGRPRGLIRYDSMNGLARKATRWIRPRIILYTALMLLGAAAMMAAISTVRPATLSLTRMTGIPYVIEQGVVRNQFLVRILNKRNTPVHFRVEINGGPAGLHWTGTEGGVSVPALGEILRPVVVTIPREDVRQSVPLRFRIVSDDGSTSIENPMPFLGPLL
jgi:cytochrome c oxidase accessory protein FixG